MKRPQERTKGMNLILRHKVPSSTASGENWGLARWELKAVNFSTLLRY
ncbi:MULTISPECIES: hypothetical protein [Methanosarcina]|nr:MULTISPECIES: hypothetical protein [Methanosarcina]